MYIQCVHSGLCLETLQQKAVATIQMERNKNISFVPLTKVLTTALAERETQQTSPAYILDMLNINKPTRLYSDIQ